MRYLVQFPAGLAPLVARALTGLCDGFTEVYADDSALVFDTASRFAAVDEIDLAKNLFVVWATAGRPPQTGGRALDRAVGRLSDSVPAAIRPSRPDPAGFRTMVQIDGQLTPVDRSTRDRLEAALAGRTGQRVHSRGGNTEYWVMGRRDHAELMLLQRLPRRRKAPGKAGTLSPELAAALVLASDPRPTDTVLDPFAGSGALLLARSRRPSGGLVYNDLDLTALRSDLPEALIGHRRTRLLSDDALTLPSLDDASVDVVITDPPWGEYAELDRPYPDFAAAMASSLARVLVDHGRLVVLVNRANTGVLTEALTGSGLDPDPPLEILVNGHPASVLVAVRRPRTMA